MWDTIKNALSNATTNKLVEAAIGVIAVLVIVSLIKKMVSKNVDNIEARFRIRKILGFIGYLAVVLLLLNIFSASLKGITVVLGIAGAGFAFALSEVIVSIAGWIAVIFGRYYSTGDRIQLGGITGDVIDIAVLRTTLMECGAWVRGNNYNGRIVRISHSFVFKEPLFNYSSDFPFLWDEIIIPIQYGSDLKMARDILSRILENTVGEYSKKAEATWKTMLRKYKLEKASVQPMVTMTANENWVEYTLRFVVEYRKRRTTKDQLFEQILEEFNRTPSVSLASTSMKVTLSQPQSSGKD